MKKQAYKNTMVFFNIWQHFTGGKQINYTQYTQHLNPAVGQVVDIAINVGGRGSIPELVKTDTVLSTARHSCDVSSELCCSGDTLERWVPALATLRRNAASIDILM